VQAAGSGLLAEQRSLAGLYDDVTAPDFDPTHYLGSADALVDELVTRARAGGRP
jgi:3-carboxy-cis,cis-muconate cycloisomerase